MLRPQDEFLRRVVLPSIFGSLMVFRTQAEGERFMQRVRRRRPSTTGATGLRRQSRPRQSGHLRRLPQFVSLDAPERAQHVNPPFAMPCFRASSVQDCIPRGGTTTEVVASSWDPAAPRSTGSALPTEAAACSCWRPGRHRMATRQAARAVEWAQREHRVHSARHRLLESLHAMCARVKKRGQATQNRLRAGATAE